MAKQFAFDVGDTVRFLGYTAEDDADMPDNAEALTEGEVYQVAKVIDGKGENEDNFEVEAANPNFDSKKRKSKTNTETVVVAVFADEIALADDEEESEEESEVEAEGEEIDFSDIEKGMDVTAVDDDGALVAEGKVEAASKLSVTIGGTKIKKSQGCTFLVDAEEEAEVAEEEAELAEGFEEEIEFADVEKGGTYLFALAGENVVGTVTKKTKLKCTVETEDGESVELASKDIQGGIFAGVEEEEVAPPSKVKTAAAKPKTKAKTKVAATKAKAEEDSSNKDIVLTEDEEDEEILALVEGSENLVETLHDLEENAVNTEWKMAGVLYHLKKDKLYEELSEAYTDGLEGFKAFCKEELSCGYRKAQYLIDVYAKFRKAGKGSEEFALIGWSKAQVIAQYLTDDNADEFDNMLEVAQESNVPNLKGSMKDAYGRQGEDQRPLIKRTNFKFSLEEDAGNSVRSVLEQAKSDLGKTGDSDVFETIVMEWATEHLSLKPAKTTTKASGKATAKAGARRQTTKAA